MDYNLKNLGFMIQVASACRQKQTFMLVVCFFLLMFKDNVVHGLICLPQIFG